MMKGVYNEDGSLNLNPNSLTVLKNCVVEENLKDAKAYDSFQFVRQGFFCVDAKDSTADHLVFNRIVSLKTHLNCLMHSIVMICIFALKRA